MGRGNLERIFRMKKKKLYNQTWIFTFLGIKSVVHLYVLWEIIIEAFEFEFSFSISCYLAMNKTQIYPPPKLK